MSLDPPPPRRRAPARPARVAAGRRAAASSPDDRARWLTLTAVVFAVFMTTLDNTVVNVALPSIAADLHVGLSGLAWVVNSYVLSFAALLLTGGRMADSFGRRRAFLSGLAAFTAASLLAGLAPDPAVLIGARVLQGAGAALMTPPTLAIIGHAFPDARERGSHVRVLSTIRRTGSMSSVGRQVLRATRVEEVCMSSISLSRSWRCWRTGMPPA